MTNNIIIRVDEYEYEFNHDIKKCFDKLVTKNYFSRGMQFATRRIQMANRRRQFPIGRQMVNRRRQIATGRQMANRRRQFPIGRQMVNRRRQIATGRQMVNRRRQFPIGIQMANRRRQIATGRGLYPYNNVYTSNIEIFTENQKVKNGCYYQLYIENNAEKITSKLIGGFDANPTNNRKVGKSPVLIEPDPKGKNVVIILESPHRDEYDFKDNQDKSTLTPIAPANGITGRSIRGGISDVISEGLGCQSEIYNIYLLNRVPYQCSLGSLYEKGLNNEIRNEIFKELWSKNQNEFFKELQSFSPNIIIESCTQAVDDKTSYYLYTEGIKKALRVSNFLKRMAFLEIKTIGNNIKRSKIRYSVKGRIDDVNKNIFYYIHPGSPGKWRECDEKLKKMKKTSALREIFTMDLAKIKKLTDEDKIKYKDIIKEKNTNTIQEVLPYWKSIKEYNFKDLLPKLIAIGIVNLKDNKKLKCIKKELES